MTQCKNCKNYNPDKELYIGTCKKIDRPTLMNDTCGCFEKEEKDNG